MTDGPIESTQEKSAAGDQRHLVKIASLDRLNLYESFQHIKTQIDKADLEHLNTASLYQIDPKHINHFVSPTGNLEQKAPADAKLDAASGAPAAPKHVVKESQHDVKQGETLEGIARAKLGPNASYAEVKAYATAIQNINSVDNPKHLQIKSPLTLPGQEADGTFTYTNPGNKDEHIVYHPDGSFESTNSKDGTSYTHIPDKNDPNSYVEVHKGRNLEQNFTHTQHADGSFEEKGANGFSVSHVPDKTDPQKYVEIHHGPNQADDYEEHYTVHPDGSYDVVNTTNGTSYTHTPDKNDPNSYIEVHKGLKQDDTWTKTQHADGSFEVNGADGRGYTHVPDKDDANKYVEVHHGPGPADKYEEHYTTHPDGSYEVVNTTNGTHYEHAPTEGDPQYQWVETHHGHKPDENYEVLQHTDGSYDVTYADGTAFTRIPGKDDDHYVVENRGPKPEDNYSVEYAGGNKVSKNPDGKIIETYDKSTNIRTDYNDDGTTYKYFPDGHTEATRAEGSKDTKYQDGSYKEERTDKNGQVTSKEHHGSADGSYTETGKGPNPSDNYLETYDIKSGITTRKEAAGTDQERTITTGPDGNVTVIAKDGKNYTRKSDGSEHHFGKETFDKPPYDYKSIDKSKNNFEDAIHNQKPPIPPEKQAALEADMATFEKRAQDQHLQPEEVSKTYDQMTRMLNTPDKDAVIPAENRALLAESFIHQCAYPNRIDQGPAGTCNVTTVAEQGYTRNPSVLAEMAATTAIKGEWVAPDGQKIEIDRNSLTPGKPESEYPTKDHNRSYASQVLSVVMVNDVTQRRNPKQYYRQEGSEGKGPNDSGERLYDAPIGGNRIQETVIDPNNPRGTIKQDVNQAPLTGADINELGHRLYSRDYDVISARSSTSIGAGVQAIDSKEALEHKVKQAKDQGKLPITMEVDGNHKPIEQNEQPGYGNHVVTIDDYNPKTGEIHISNSWGKDSDEWVKPEDLYENSSGNNAEKQAKADQVENSKMGRNSFESNLVAGDSPQEPTPFHGDLPAPPQTDRTQHISDLSAVSDIDIPSSWKRSDQSFRTGYATTFVDPSSDSLQITMLQHSKNLDKTAQEAFANLLSTKVDGASLDAKNAPLLNSIASILGSSQIGDNQIVNPGQDPNIRPPAFHLETAKVENVNGKNVLEITGWYPQRSTQGNENQRKYYDGVFAVDASHPNAVSELYFQANNDTAYKKGVEVFKAALSSIKWK